MKIPALIRNWTLPLSMLLGTAVYLLFYLTPALDPAARFFGPAIDQALPWFMFLILFVTFCRVDFRSLRPEWWHLWAILAQLILVLAIVAVLLLIPLTPSQKTLWEGILTCVIGPTAASAAVVTVKLGGTLHSITTYTFLSSFVTALLIPTFFPLVEPAAALTFCTAFLLILRRVCLILILPLGLAWIVRHRLPRLQQAVVSVPDLAYYLWAASLTIVTGTTVKYILHARATLTLLLLIALSSLLLCILQFALGKAIGHPSRNTINAGQALGQKNTAFAIWITYTYLNPVASVGPGCYVLWQNLVNSWQLYRQRQG